MGCIPGGPLEPRKFQWDAFRTALREHGWIEGKNVVIEIRAPAKEGDPYDDIAADFVQRKMDVIVATGTRAIRTLRTRTTTIPIVMSPAADPVKDGLAASLARPGGNITGVSIVQVDTSGKRLEILREIVPTLSRLAVLGGPATEQEQRQVQDTANRLGIRTFEARVSSPDELAQAFASLAAQHAQALYIAQNPMMFGSRNQIVELAARHRLPTVYGLATFVQVGGLVAYGVSDTEYYRRAASYVDRILRGAKPAELPIEQLSIFQLSVNLRAARQIGIEFPRNLMLRADHIVE